MESQENAKRIHPVAQTTVTAVSFPDEQGVTRYLLQIPIEDERVLHIEIAKPQSTWNIRLEEWDENVPDMLAYGLGAIKMEKNE
jgi:hypothetical protein